MDSLLVAATGITSITSAIFAAMLYRQYRERQKIHQLVWFIAVILFFLSAFLEFISALADGWNPTYSYFQYRLYYISTPPQVGLLGAGVLYLLFGKKWGKYFTGYIITLSILLVILGLTSPLNESVFTEGVRVGDQLIKTVQVGGEPMASSVRMLSPLMTIPGGLAVIVGALYSYSKDRTRSYNLLIAGGALIPFLGGLMMRAYRYTAYFYTMEAAGTTILLTGYFLSIRYIKKREERKRERKSGKIS